MDGTNFISVGNLTVHQGLDQISYTPLTFDNVFTKMVVPKVKQVIYNPPATIVMWDDGTKTVVKCMDQEWYSPYYGFCACICKKMFGSSSAARRAAGIPKEKRSKDVKVFKVGDIVRIKNNLLGAFDVPDDMWEYKGKVATITRVLSLGVYHLDVDGGKWNWYETLLERVKK